MNNDSTTAGRPLIVRVTRLGGDTVTMTHADGMTVEECLKQAEIVLTTSEAITLDGSAATPATAVRPNSTIVIAPRVSNG